MARFGRMPMPWLVTMAMSATMPSDTAIGMFNSTSASTAPNSKSMMVIAVRRVSSVQPFGQRNARARRRRRLRADDEIEKISHFGDDDEHRRYRDHRLHHANGHPRQADHRVGREHRQDKRAD